MRITGFARLAGITFLVMPGFQYVVPQDQPKATTVSNAPAVITGHPFTAIKFARRVKVLPDGKLQFVRNERYPTRIARDSDGRLMMQVVNEFPACNWPDLPVPPVCPIWTVFVVDPVTHTVTHWGEGEIAGKEAADFPLTQSGLEEAVAATSSPPALKPDFSEDGEVSTADLGDKTIEGIRVHGVRSTLHYDVNQNGQIVHRTRIHEVWTSQDMQLVVRVIDSDPNGEETVWGLEKISLAPDASLFHSPEGYGTHHNKSDELCAQDFENLKSWFEK